MQFDIRNRWTDAIQFTAEIDCSADAPIGVKVGLAVHWGRASGANLSDADLSGANLSDADLSGANLSDADLSGVALSGIPVIKDIHSAVYAAASEPGALDMMAWHTCTTTHCRAGWVTHLAGAGGAALEWAMGTPAAAALIYLASDPAIERIPNFYATDADALADMKRLAESEGAS